MSQPIDRAHVEVVPDIDKFLKQVQRDLDKAFKNAAKDIDKHVGSIEKDFRKLGDDITKDFNRVGREGGRQLADGISKQRKDVQNALKSLFVGFVLGPEIQLILRQVRGNLLVGIAGIGAAAVQAFAQALAPLAVTFASALAFLPGLLVSVKTAMGVLQVATIGVGDAMKAVAEEDAAKLEEALKKLAPSARAFVLELQNVQKALKPIQQQMQQALFAGIDTNIALIGRNLKALRPELVGVATAFNGIFRDVTRWLGTIGALVSMRNVLGGIRDFVNAIRPGVLAVVEAFGRLAGAAGQFGGQFGEVLNRLLLQFANFLDTIDLAEVVKNISTAIQTFTPILRILGVVFSVLNQVATAFRHALDALAPALGTLGQIIAQLAIAMGPGLEALILGIGEGLKALAPAAAPVGQALSAIGTALGPIIAALGPALANILIVIATAISGVLTAAQPFIELFAGALSQVLQAITPVLLTLAQTLLPQIASAAQQMFTAFQPLIPVIAQLATQFISQLLPGLVQLAQAALTQLLPAFIQFAMDLAPVLLEALQQIQPHIPMLVEAFLALAAVVIEMMTGFRPLLPLLLQAIIIFVRMGAGIMSVSLTVAGFLITALKKAGQWFGMTIAVVQNVMNWFRQLGARIREIVSNAINRIKDIPKRAREAFGNAKTILFNAGKNVIQGLIDGIKNMIGKLKDTVKGAVATIRDHLPFSPAKIGPLSGSGDPTIAGQKIAQMIAAGIRSQTGVVAAALTPLLTPAMAGPAGLADDIGRSIDVAPRRDDEGDVHVTVIIDGKALDESVVRVSKQRDRDLKRRVQSKTGTF